MDKLILSMPGDVIEKYLEEHFNEITITDFFELVDRNINISSKLFNNNLELLKNKEVLYYIFKTNKEIPEFIASEIVKNGTEITFDDVKKYDSLRNNLKLLNYVYQTEPRVILLFPRAFILYRIARDAVKKGVVASEEDILFNPVLKDIAPIMEASIKYNPKLIKYVTEFTGIQLSDEVIFDALEHYKLTKEDLINNPELCNVFSIISKVPELSFYSKFLTEEDKVSIIEELLKDQKYDAIVDLPFFIKELGGRASSDNIKWLINFLPKEIPENDNFEQKQYQKILDYLIDGIVTNMYYKQKNEFIYSDNVAIANDLKKYFYESRDTNNEKPLKTFVSKLYEFVNLNIKGKKIISSEYLFSRIQDLYYDFLKEENSILSNNASIFYNEILNSHRNSFCSIEKNKILTKLKYRLPLNERKKTSIYNGKKMMKITYLLAMKNYESLDITEEGIKENLIKVENEISNNKDLINSYGKIPTDIFNYFNTYFLNSGQLDYITISHVLGTTDIEVIHYILKKYEQIKVDLLNKVELTVADKDITQEQISKLGLNALNFNIASNDINHRNIATLLLNINDEKINMIKENQHVINDILKILPYADLLPNFDIEQVIKILCNYSKIKNKIISVYNVESANDMFVISKFNDVIGLANGYDSMTNLYEAVLGAEIVEKISAKEIKEYFDFYFKMLNKISCSIPKVAGEYNGKIYESGDFSDVDRLLIGKNYPGSCIDLTNTAGQDAYVECLSQQTGDVIIIRDKDTKKFSARLLMFRQGNIVQLANVYSVNDNEMYYNQDFFEEIADQIIKQATLVGDNIDYVFFTADAAKNTNFKKYRNESFYYSFAHADLSTDAYLVAVNPAVKDKKVEENLKFSAEIKYLYPKIRKKVSNNPNEAELTRLKAIKIALEKDEIKRKELERTFEPFLKNEFIHVLSGEDWYVGLRKDGEIEELVLPSNDPRTMLEVDQARFSIQSLFDNTLIRK